MYCVVTRVNVDLSTVFIANLESAISCTTKIIRLFASSFIIHVSEYQFSSTPLTGFIVIVHQVFHDESNILSNL